MPDPRQISIESTAITPEEIANRSFPTARRGLDADAVRRFLDELAGQLRGARAREAELRAALEEAERRAASPDLDEATLTTALGAETAKVIHAAHEAAREVVARAEARAAELTGEAERVLAERTEAAVNEAGAMVVRARQDADSLLAEARDECRQMVAEAREARRRILNDLADRRRSLHTQIEQIRAAKDALAEVVEQTAVAIAEIKANVGASEQAARRAADEAALVASSLAGEPSIDELVAEALAAFDEPADVTADGGRAPESDEERVLEAAAVAVLDPSDEEAESATEPVLELGTRVEDEPPAPELGLAAEPASGGPETEDEDVTPATTSAVDELFARIRASRAADVAEAHSVLSNVAGEAPAEVDRGTEPTSELRASDERASEVIAFEDSEVEPDGGEPDSEVEPGGKEPAPAQRRDVLLAPAAAELARAVKRTLRSEQNELLAAARKADAGELSALLPGEQSLQRLADAARPAIVEAFRAGQALAGELLGSDDLVSDAGDDVSSLAGGLASEVVGRIRDHLAQAFAHSGDVEPAGAIVGSAYREWKGERVEIVAGDFASQAFSLGLLGAASKDGALVVWSVAEDTTPCPDCDDNVLAGPQPPGEAFPTGQSVPPVHSGCRCLLLPVTG